MKKIFLCLALYSLFAGSVLLAKLYTWNGTSGNGNWTTTALWNLNDGTYPHTAGDTAYLTSASVYPCSLKVSDTVNCVRIAASYTGVFTMGTTSTNKFYLYNSFIDSGITGLRRYGGGFYGLQGGVNIIIAPSGTVIANTATITFQGTGNILKNHKGPAGIFGWFNTVGTHTTMTLNGSQQTYLDGITMPLLTLLAQDTITTTGCTFDFQPVTNGNVWNIDHTAGWNGTSAILADLSANGGKFTFPFLRYSGSGNTQINTSVGYNDTVIFNDTFDVNIRQLNLGGSAAGAGFAYYGNGVTVVCGTLRFGTTGTGNSNMYFGNSGNSKYYCRVFDGASSNSATATTQNDFFGNAQFSISGNYSIGSHHAISKDSGILYFRPTDTATTFTTANKAVPSIIIDKKTTKTWTAADSITCDSLVLDSGKVSFAGQYVCVNKTYRNNITRDTTNVSALARIFKGNIIINDTAVTTFDTCPHQIRGTAAQNITAKWHYFPNILIKALSFNLQSDLHCKNLIDSTGALITNKHVMEVTGNLGLFDSSKIDTTVLVWKSAALIASSRPEWAVGNAMKFQYSPLCTVSTAGNRWGNVYISKTHDSKVSLTDTLKCHVLNHESGIFNASQPIDVR